MFKAEHARNPPRATMSFIRGCATKGEDSTREDEHTRNICDASELLCQQQLMRTSTHSRVLVDAVQPSSPACKYPR